MSQPPITRTPPFTCVGCGRLLDCLGDVTGKDIVPQPGDITFCMNCTTPYIITEQYGGRLLTQADTDKMTPEEVKDIMEQKLMLIAFKMATNPRRRKEH